jgi:hypothetical protein
VVKVTTVPIANPAEQLFGQEMPLGELVTVPLPLSPTESVAVVANVAVTLLAAVMVTVQVCAVPEQAPDQPLKTKPDDGEAVRITDVPYENVVPQIPGQEMPPGELSTVPLPVTPTVSVSGIAVNVALTLWGLYMVRLHPPVPEQAPDQPENVYPVLGDADSVIVFP